MFSIKKIRILLKATIIITKNPHGFFLFIKIGGNKSEKHLFLNIALKIGIIINLLEIKKTCLCI